VVRGDGKKKRKRGVHNGWANLATSRVLHKANGMASHAMKWHEVTKVSYPVVLRVSGK
jgi:hypothetical protein